MTSGYHLAKSSFFLHSIPKRLTYYFLTYFFSYFFSCGASKASVKFSCFTSILCPSKNFNTESLETSTVAELSIGWKAQNSCLNRVSSMIQHLTWCCSSLAKAKTLTPPFCALSTVETCYYWAMRTLLWVVPTFFQKALIKKNEYLFMV